MNCIFIIKLSKEPSFLWNINRLRIIHENLLSLNVTQKDQEMLSQENAINVQGKNYNNSLK